MSEAERAVRIYFHTFQNGAAVAVRPAPAVAAAADGTVAKAEVLESARNLLRVKHYSYRTEQTYLEWMGRFFRYCGGAICIEDHEGAAWVVAFCDSLPPV